MYLFSEAGPSQLSLHLSQGKLILLPLGSFCGGAILQLLQARLKVLQLAFYRVLLLQRMPFETLHRTESHRSAQK